MSTTLKSYKPGDSGTVIRVAADGKIKRRLFDMGVTPGAEITVRKLAPLGDPIEVTIRGYELSLRLSEAETVIMEDAK